MIEYVYMHVYISLTVTIYPFLEEITYIFVSRCIFPQNCSQKNLRFLWMYYNCMTGITTCLINSIYIQNFISRIFYTYFCNLIIFRAKKIYNIFKYDIEKE